ncbi:MAG: Holliday junction branch migration protein RuvA [Candidatus Peribacteraceae bacterium]|jgi:Holliday junction DNA helicase RuvA|nr:Holliday junction branch migration protein RuvA [Candidatus Peribacteraceae bacterium]|tara:strand:+ start:303 stop:887 length:585 start_codon:yes stop_codon:yes gene_type:complete
MISLLRGIITKGQPNEITIDVQGVGYAVHVPIDVWDSTIEGEESEILISSYIREDRFDLFGFKDRASKMLFEEAINLPGIGPKTALEICSVPRNMLLIAVEQQDMKLLNSIKGIGKKTAEKLLVDLKSLTEKQPEIFAKEMTEKSDRTAEYDQDAIEALTTLGYPAATALKVLKEIPSECKTSEERVAAALRSL